MSKTSFLSRKPVITVTALLALGLGGAALHAQGTTPAPTQPAVAPAFNPALARTENERNTVDVVRAAQDGLVYVSVQSKVPTAGAPGPGSQGQGSQGNPFAGTPFANLPFGGNGLQDLQAVPQRGTGSGFFIDSRGDILTNYHVVEGASTITIRVHNRPETYTARVIGTAPDYDLALIRADKLPAALIRPLPLGNSDALAPGLKAIALGAPFGLDFSVTEGIISATARKVPVGVRGVDQSVIQTDASINPGNSGGPLLDSSGQVIGINTQILTGGSQQSAGVGFSIPINVAKALLPRLETGAHITTPTLGIRYIDLGSLDPATLQQLKLPTQGALVGAVETGSPAQRAGLKAGQQQITLSDGTPITLGGDVITQINGRPISETNTLQSAIFGRSVGDTVSLTVLRNGRTQQLDVKLTAFTPSTAASGQ